MCTSKRFLHPLFFCLGLASFGAGCATTIEGHQRGLFFSTSTGLSRQPVGSGTHWHWPWNDYITYDLRWSSHKEKVDITSKDGLHLDIDVSVVARVDQRDLYAVETEIGPKYYDTVIRPATFGAVRAAASRFGHFEMVTRPKEFERAIRDGLLELLKGKRVEISEVAIQHLDLPPEVVQAANRAATASQLLAARDAELALAERDGRVAQEKKRSALTTQGLERRLQGEQELEQATMQIRIEGEKRKAELAKVQAEADAVRIRAEAEAQAIQVRAGAEKTRIQALSQNLSPNYVRIQALDALAKALSGPGTTKMVLPVGKDGLPTYLAPFLNPFGPFFGQGMGAEPAASGGR